MTNEKIIELELIKNLKPIETKERRIENSYSTVTVYEFEGYEIVDERRCYNGEEELRYISISIKDWNNRYLPEIRYNNWGEEKEFKIQTTSYGSLKPEEIKEVIKGYETAMYVVAVIKNELF